MDIKNVAAGFVTLAVDAGLTIGTLKGIYNQDPVQSLGFSVSSLISGIGVRKLCRCIIKPCAAYSSTIPEEPSIYNTVRKVALNTALGSYFAYGITKIVTSHTDKAPYMNFNSDTPLIKIGLSVATFAAFAAIQCIWKGRSQQASTSPTSSQAEHVDIEVTAV